MDIQEKVVTLFMDMTAISSPSFEEKQIFDYIERHLSGKNLSVRRISYYSEKFKKQTENMLINISATDPNKKGLFFDAHADTVNPCHNVKPIIDGDIIKSSGDTVLGADDKCGIASMLVAIDILLETQIPHGELLFIVSSAEEVGLMGARFIPKEEFQGLHYGIILDSGGPVGSINLRAPYHYEYRINVIGKASHAGIAPEKGVNAIKAAAHVIMDLPSGRISSDTVCNVGLINGGSGRNIVPDHVEIVGEVRSIVQKKCDPILEQVKNAVEKHKSQAIDIRCHIEQSNIGYDFTENSPIITFIAEGLNAIGIVPCYEESCGGTNANIYTVHNIDCTVISVGMEEIHSTNEFIYIQDLVDTTKLILQLIKQS
ncbi:MAG: M20/M25/M40 family metallo-hydrolase [Brevinema sp.]